MVYHGKEQGGSLVVILQAVMIVSTTDKGESFYWLHVHGSYFFATELYKDLFSEVIFLQFG